MYQKQRKVEILVVIIYSCCPKHNVILTLFWFTDRLLQILIRIFVNIQHTDIVAPVRYSTKKCVANGPPHVCRQ